MTQGDNQASAAAQLWVTSHPAILKDVEDSAPDSFTLTQDMHRHKAGPLGKKLQLSLVHRETVIQTCKLFPYWNNYAQRFLLLLLFFFDNCYKRVHAFREDSWMESTDRSPGCFVWLWFLLPSENLTTQSLLPPSSSKRQKSMFSTYRNMGSNAVSLIILSGVIFLIGLENTDSP